MSAITREVVLQMDLKSILAAVKDPTTSKDMQSLLRDRVVASRVSELMLEAQNREEAVDAQLNRVIPPSTEELAAEAAKMAAATAEAIAMNAPLPADMPTDDIPKAVPVVNNHEAEDAEWLAAGVTIVRDAQGKATRYIEEYQVTGEDGKNIGRPTHLEARTLVELAAKKREVHVQATRAFHRLKQQKLSFKQEKTILSPEAIAEAARVALEEKDSSKITDVIHATIESSYQKRETELKNKEAYETGRAISNQWMRHHLHDYNPCDANKKAMNDYFVENNLELTHDNLEAAFQDLLEQGDKLAKVETVATRQAVVVPNPVPAATAATPAPPVIPVAETPIAVPVPIVAAQPAVPSQPVVEATVATSAAAPNVPVPARRPGVNGGLPPGSLSAQRPGTPDPALARKEFLKTVKDMDPKVMRAKLKTDPQFVKQLQAYGIQIR
jgi:hypothetical protein